MNTMTRYRLVRVLMATTMLATLGDLAAAEAQQTTTTDDSTTVTLPAVVVNGTAETATGHVEGYTAKRSETATKTDAPIIETPQSISVVTSDQIKATNAESLNEAFAYTPGVVGQSAAFSGTVDDFTVRGFDIANGNLGMLRDGMKLQSNVYDGGQEPYGLERVELLRGPSSILYGASSPGGVINAVSKLPSADPYHEFNLSYGSYDRFQVSGDTTGPVISDGTLTYRLTALYRTSDTWVDYMKDDKIYVAPSFTWKPNENNSFTLLASYQQIRSTFSAPLPYADLIDEVIPRDRFIGEPDFDRYDTDVYTIGYMFEHRFSDQLTLRNKARYYDASVLWDYLQYGLRDGSTLYRSVSSRDEHSTGITSDTSLEYKFLTGPIEHTAVFGIDTYRSTYENHRYTGTITTLDLDNPDYGTDITVNRSVDRGTRSRGDQVGLYLQDQFKIDKHWVFLLGGRQDWSFAQTTTRRTGATVKADDNAFSGRAGLVYLFDNGLAPYVSFSQSFTPTTGQTDREGNPFKPTYGTQYEGGVRYEPPGQNFSVSAAVFQITQTDVLIPDPVDSTYSVQTGEVRSRGFELEGKMKFGPLNVIASYAYTDARTTKSNDASEIGQRVDLVPYNTIGLWADRTFDDLGVRGLKIGAGVQYLGDTNVTGQQADNDGYALVNAMASYDLGVLSQTLEGTSLSVNANNLFDTKYMTCVTSTGCRYGAPMTVTATLSYHW